MPNITILRRSLISSFLAACNAREDTGTPFAHLSHIFLDQLYYVILASLPRRPYGTSTDLSLPLTHPTAHTSTAHCHIE